MRLNVRIFDCWVGIFGGVAAFFFLLCCPTDSATIAVSPVQLYLSRGNSSTELTITNQSLESIRFSVAGYSWGQSVTNPLILRSTSDVVFFPALFSLAAGQQRRVRIGTTGEVSSAETAYRIIVEELPPLSSVVGNPTPGVGLTIRTRLSLPLFVKPRHQTTSAQFTKPELRHGTLGFSVINTGNVHLQLQKVVVNAFDRQDRSVFATTLNGWYVLPAATRRFAVRISKAHCQTISRVNLRLVSEDLSVKQQFDRISVDCSTTASL